MGSCRYLSVGQRRIIVRRRRNGRATRCGARERSLGRKAMVVARGRSQQRVKRVVPFWNPREPTRGRRMWRPRCLYFLACAHFWRWLRRSSRSILSLPRRKSKLGGLSCGKSQCNTPRSGSRENPGVYESRREIPSALRTLSRDAVDEVENLRTYEGGDIVVQLKSGEGVRASDMALLLSGGWLNSEVVNTYMALIEIRSESHRNSVNSKLLSRRVFPRLCAYSSFFFQKLVTSGYDGVHRWKNKINWFEYDIILIPVNYVQSHWALVAVNMQRRTVEYYDSLLHRASAKTYQSILTSVMGFLTQASMHKRGTELETDQWTKEIVDGIPQQEDGSGCGVHLCVVAELLARGVQSPFSFSSNDIPQMRWGIAAELLAGRGC